jgi:hypothetical protein
MVSWNELPYDVRHSILSEFAKIVLNEYNQRRDWFEGYYTPKLWAHLKSPEPLPLVSFASALRVNRGFSDLLNRITLGGDRAVEKLKMAQWELCEIALNTFDFRFDDYEQRALMQLDHLTSVVGNFWKNHDYFPHGVNILSRISSILGWEQCEKVFLFCLLPFLQHLSETVPPSTSFAKPPKNMEWDESDWDWRTHPLTHFGEELYREMFSRREIYADRLLSWGITVFRVVATDLVKNCAVTEEIKVSPSREWLAVSICAGWTTLDYCVNFKKRRLFEFKYRHTCNFHFPGFYFPGGWTDVSDEVGEMWGNV